MQRFLGLVGIPQFGGNFPVWWGLQMPVQTFISKMQTFLRITIFTFSELWFEAPVCCTLINKIMSLKTIKDRRSIFTHPWPRSCSGHFSWTWQIKSSRVLLLRIPKVEDRATGFWDTSNGSWLEVLRMLLSREVFITVQWSKLWRTTSSSPGSIVAVTTTVGLTAAPTIGPTVALSLLV